MPYEHLMANADPDLVKIELDIGWLAVAVSTRSSTCTRYAGRVVACRLKDCVDVSDDPLGAVERGHRHLEELRACD